MAKRRANNEGSISRRKDGTWRGEISLGYVNGKRDRKTVYGRSQGEVLEKLEKLKREVATGAYSDSKQTVAEYLTAWLAEKERHLKRTTIERKYRYCLDKHIKPRIGRHALEKLKPLHIQKMVGQIADAAGVPTANNCRRVLFTALKQAMQWQLLVRNPVEAVAPLPETPREMILWTPQQAARFLDTALAHRLHALFYLDMSTGLRRGELLALRWQDIQGNIVHVRQTMSYVKGQFIFSAPKTKQGFRRVPVTADVLDVLEQQKQHQQAERDFLGEAWPDSDLIFTSKVGTPIYPDNLTRLRIELMEKAEVPRIRLHDLRHLHASVAIKNGVDPKVLADRLGHSRASFTLDTYTHLFEEQRETAAISLLDFLPSTELERLN